jgi:hypothetical protein
LIRYNCDVKFLVDIIYIYENISFIIGVGDLYLDNNSIIISYCYMEIDELKDNSIFNDSTIGMCK